MSLQGFYTSKGLALAARVAAGAGLTVTRVTAGGGTTAADASALAGEKQTLTVGPAQAEGQTVTLPVTLAEGKAGASYTLAEIGVYARDPDAGEILYQVFRLDESRAICAGGESVYRFYLRQAMGADGVTIACSPAGLLIDEDLAPLRRAMAKKPDAQLDNLTLYVAKTGSDETGDGSEGKPFLTIQRAVSSLPDLLLGTVTIRVAAGYYAENVLIWGFVGVGITLTAEDDASVSVDSIEIGRCTNEYISINGFSLVGNTNSFSGNSLRLLSASCLELHNITCTAAVSTQSVGALFLCNCPFVFIDNSTISNKEIALDIVGSTVYLNHTVTGVNNTVGIRCGSGWGSKGGYVQKGGATIAGEEQKGFGGQIW